MSSRRKDGANLLTRREILKGMALTPVALRAAPIFAGPLPSGSPGLNPDPVPGARFADLRLKPDYPAQSPLADIFELVRPGSDGYITEKWADEIGSVLNEWSDALTAAPERVAALAHSLDEAIEASTLVAARETVLRNAFGIRSVRRQFLPGLVPGRSVWGELVTGTNRAQSAVDAIKAQTPALPADVAKAVLDALDNTYDATVQLTPKEN